MDNFDLICYIWRIAKMNKSEDDLTTKGAILLEKLYNEHTIPSEAFKKLMEKD